MPERLWSRTHKRLLVLLVVSLILHALALGLIPRWHPPFVDRRTQLTATLVALPPTRVASPSAPSPALQKKVRIAPPHPKPPPRPVPAPRPATESLPLMSAQNTAPPDAHFTTPAPAAVTNATPNAAESDRARGTPSDAAPSKAASAASAAPLASSPPVDPPRSATLYYNVVAKDPRHDPNQSLVGNGVMTWAIEQNHYTLGLSATVNLLFVSLKVLESRSEGEIDVHGLEPLRYTETPRNRQPLVTVFDHGPPRLGTSAGGAQTLPAGIQDRLSVVLQLGALLRANPALTQTTAQFDVPVAGLRGDVANWTFFVFGDEAVATPLGTIHAVHLLRLMRRDTNDRELELWIALGRGGYPVRIRYTEPNESYVDLALTKIQ